MGAKIIKHHTGGFKAIRFYFLKIFPLDTTLDSPWTMHCETMVKVFKHIAAYQASYGIQDALDSKPYFQAVKRGLYVQPAILIQTSCK